MGTNKNGVKKKEAKNAKDKLRKAGKTAMKSDERYTAIFRKRSSFA